jgi:hypothetical protein
MDRVLLATTAQTEADFDETKHSVIKYGKRQTVTVGEDDSGELQVGIQMGRRVRRVRVRTGVGVVVEA